VEEWPEVLKVVGKLVRREELNQGDEGWIKEVSETCGWGGMMLLTRVLLT
jgi:hypothetical protein